MKMSVIYYSKTGTTKEMAEVIVSGMEIVEGVEARSFSIDAIDEAWVKESKCVIVGTPIYMASVTAVLKEWLENGARELGLNDKIGGAFATAAYVHGGAELGIRTILDHMMCFGMITYSGGGAFGNPVIHLGPVALSEKLEESKPTFELYGKRMAQKTVEIFA